jgi:hypothetical protein
MRIALAALLLLMAGLAVPSVAADRALDDLMFELQLVPLDGQPAPAFALERFGDGKKVTLAEHRGLVVMLYFWATW